MDETRYRVIFDGSLTGEFDEETARQQFAKLFRLDPAKAATYFSGRERILKSDISESLALEYMMRVAETGCECYIEEIMEGPPDGIEERRSRSERRNRFRRGPRPGAIVPDRRLKIRRAEDRRQFRNLRDKGLDLPLAFQPYPRDAGTG